jgi:hypothetical protein
LEERKKNPMKELAILLAHAMDIQERALDQDLREHEIQENRAYLTLVNNEIHKKGYDVQMMLHLAEQYKALTWAEWKEWVYI